MNYCEHHLGDYAKRTGAFTMLEHGAYAKLRDRYFVTEAGIPAGDVYRQAGARSKEERAAVEAVLLEFYALKDGVWVCADFDLQLTQAQARIKAAQSNGKLGGRQKGTQKKPSGLPVGSTWAPQTKAHQSPVPKHHTPEEDSVVGGSSHGGPDDDRKPEKPATWEGWRAWFDEVHGITCDPYSPQDRTKFRPLAQRWLDAGVTFAQMAGAIAKAHAESTEPIAYLPAYADRVLATMSGPPNQAAPSRQSALEQRNADTVRQLMAAHNLGDDE